MKIRTRLIALLGFIALTGCTTISPTLRGPADDSVNVFSHERLDRALQHSVNDQGRVNYTALKDQPEDIEAYYRLISEYSPDSHPELFPTENERLAYWINAYNAAVIKIVLTYYPISGIEDVKPPFPLFFFPDKTGFFVFHRPTFGSVSTSLYYLENSVIRERFSEPRVHFALNCASRGCPRLPNSAFGGQQLDAQLDREARRFFAEERNLKIDDANKTVYLSSILNWYEDDFIGWYQQRHPGGEATLLDYVALYLPEERSRRLKAVATDYALEFVPYDWKLNDQNPI